MLGDAARLAEAMEMAAVAGIPDVNGPQGGGGGLAGAAGAPSWVRTTQMSRSLFGVKLSRKGTGRVAGPSAGAAFGRNG